MDSVVVPAAPGGPDGTDWVRDLVPADDRPVPIPHCSLELLTRITAMAGPEPVMWALQVGGDAAETIFEAIPAFGTTQELRDMLLAATESATLGALGMLAGPDNEPPPLTEEAKIAVADYARHDVPVEQILRGIRFGHAVMSSAFLAAGDALAASDRRTAVLRTVSARLFDHMDRYGREAADHYNTEHAAWSASSGAAKRRIVEAILAGSDVPPGDLAALAYDPAQANRAVIVTCVDGAAAGLQQVAYDVLRRAGATSQLVVPVTGATVWAWGGRAACSGAPLPAMPVEGFRVAFGAELRRVDGFRESHEQAIKVAALQEVAGGAPGALAFADVELAVLLAGDLPGARRFVGRVLGPLAAASQRNLDILTTVKAYLDLCGSPSAVAERLNLARNTVSARIQRASRMLDREIGIDCVDLHAALVLVELLGDQVLTEP